MFLTLFVSMSQCISLLIVVNILAPCVLFLSVLCIKHAERKYHLMDHKLVVRGPAMDQNMLYGVRHFRKLCSQF